MAGRRLSLGSLLALLLVPLGAQAQDLNEQLLAAARKSDTEAVKSLLAKGADVNAKTRYGATALSYACDRGSLDVVKVLVEHGADVNVKDTFYGATPLTWAASNNHVEVVKLLLEKGAQSKEVAMSIGVGRGHLKLVEALLAIGGFKPEVLNTYLSAATRGGHSEIAELLKKAGATVPPPFQVSPDQLRAYEGKFRSGETELTFTLREGKLVGATSTGQTIVLVPAAKHVFRAAEIDGISFTFALEGEKVTAMTLKQPNGSETTFKRDDVRKAEGQ